MQTIQEVLDHPQTKALEILQKSPSGDISLLGLPLSFDDKRPGFRHAPPALGEHTRQILNEIAAKADV
jgi:crotonobetainyl-CoA:carnitine CoA-transferase CaiB-like acyl-CoA transferase